MSSNAVQNELGSKHLYMLDNHTKVVYVTVDENPIPSSLPDMGMGLVDGLGLGLLTPPLRPTDEGVLLPSPPLCTASVKVWSPTSEVPVAVHVPGEAPDGGGCSWCPPPPPPSPSLES